MSVAIMTLPQNQASTQLGKHAIRQARNQASTKSSRLRLIISDRRAKIIQFTATKPANLIQLLQIFFGASLVTKHQKQFALIFQRALMLWIKRQGRFIIFRPPRPACPICDGQTQVNFGYRHLFSPQLRPLSASQWLDRNFYP